MKTRAIWITVLMLAGLAVSSRHICMIAIARSTHAFYGYFQSLREESLNPVQRVVFSLALTRAEAHQAPKRHTHL
ncbi:MAG: hypothetical protein ACLP59_13940 [Bryobacteraceae bacterium]